jgi:hypothetical protein
VRRDLDISRTHFDEFVFNTRVASESDHVGDSSQSKCKWSAIALIDKILWPLSRAIPVM